MDNNVLYQGYQMHVNKCETAANIIRLYPQMQAELEISSLLRIYTLVKENEGKQIRSLADLRIVAGQQGTDTDKLVAYFSGYAEAALLGNGALFSAKDITDIITARTDLEHWIYNILAEVFAPKR